jgi:hypothetical protein
VVVGVGALEAAIRTAKAARRASRATATNAFFFPGKALPLAGLAP